MFLPTLFAAAEAHVIRLSNMKFELEKPEPFDLTCLVLFILFFALSIYLFFKSKTLLGIVLMIFSISAFVIFFGRIVLGSAYLEGHMVRLLIKNSGRMHIDEIHNYYAKYGSFDFVVNRLRNRGVIEDKDGYIELIEENIAKGYKNRLMIWGTRRIKL